MQGLHDHHISSYEAEYVTEFWICSCLVRANMVSLDVRQTIQFENINYERKS